MLANYIDTLIPLAGGILCLILPVRRKSEDEPQETVDARRKKLRLCGVVLLGVAGIYFLVKAGGQ
jgi:hypothetical protein